MQQFLLGLGMLVAAILPSEKHVLVSPVPDNYQAPIPVIAIMRNRNEELKSVVTKSLEGTTGKYAVVIKNLKTGTYYAQNENEVMHAASLYKMWLTARVFEQIRAGEISGDDVMSSSVVDLNNYYGIAPEDAELTTGYFNYTVNEAVNQAISISHNYAALMLLKKIGGYDEVELFLKENNLNNSSFKIKPQTTAGDIAKFLEKVYKKEIGDEQISEWLIEVLAKNRLNEGLPKYLPQTMQISHKTGEIFGFKHDAGIIFNQSGDYIIVVMSESNSPFGAEERIAQLSKAVYDYFNLP
ncbi:MAG: serine hydrolase [bacterium]|nr:serine hydrolase [bacterium]